MAATPPHICGGCRRIVVGPCARCARRRDVARGSAQARYGPDWARIARDWLRHYPWCGQRLDGLFHVEHSDCARQQLRVPAQHTDHIVAVSNGGNISDRNNLQSLCARCNARKRSRVDSRGAKSRTAT